MDELLGLPHEGKGSQNGLRVLLWDRRKGDVGEVAGGGREGRVEGLGFQITSSSMVEHLPSMLPMALSPLPKQGKTHTVGLPLSLTS